MILEEEKRAEKRIHHSKEGKIQSDCVIWFHNSFPAYRGLLFHVPNENDRSDSNPIQGSIRRSLGVVAGVSDLILLVPRKGHGALLIEMKDDKGIQRQVQKDWQKIVESQGYVYRICRSLDQFKTIINEYLCLD